MVKLHAVILGSFAVQENPEFLHASMDKTTTITGKEFFFFT